MGGEWPPLKVKAESCVEPRECLEACRRGPVRVDLSLLARMLGEVLGDCVVLVEPRGCGSGSTGSGASRPARR